MKGFLIGHYTDAAGGTGCTVVLCPEGTIGSGMVRGAAPGTREYALLDPHRKVEEIHAVFLTGGSAFGLDAAAGVMRFLKERDVGFPTIFGKVPIVPAAVVYDLYSGQSESFPTAENAYEACQRAEEGEPPQGRVGAGTGVTVGKWAGLEYMMPAGIGWAQVVWKNVQVEALSVVNPVGDVVDGQGNIIAGAQKDGRFLAQGNPTLRWEPPDVGLGQNTILTVLMTNARLTKLQLHLMADRAHLGIARAVVPSHTAYDGDIVFTLSRGEVPVNSETVFEMGIEAVRQSILNAVSY